MRTKDEVILQERLSKSNRPISDSSKISILNINEVSRNTERVAGWTKDFPAATENTKHCASEKVDIFYPWSIVPGWRTDQTIRIEKKKKKIERFVNVLINLDYRTLSGQVLPSSFGWMFFDVEFKVDQMSPLL